MGFLNSNKNYIKLELLDNDKVKCSLYKNKNDRDKEKNTTSYKIIIEKYEELIKKSYSEAYNNLKEYGLQGFLSDGSEAIKNKEDLKLATDLVKDFLDLNREYATYLGDVHDKNGSNHKFPIISKYFPDVIDSIPYHYSSSITLSIGEVTNISEAYIKLKEIKAFGETVDC